MRCSPPIAAGSASARPRFVTRAAAGWLTPPFGVGDLIGLLGWRPPLRSTTRRELMRGAVGDPAPWTRLTGIAPRALGAALAAEPASVQERWFARLYFAKPLMLAVLALYWIATGLVALGPGWEDAVGLVQEAGFAGCRPAGGCGRHRRHRHRRRHRRPAHRQARALGCIGAVDRLPGACHAVAAGRCGPTRWAPC